MGARADPSRPSSRSTSSCAARGRKISDGATRPRRRPGQRRNQIPDTINIAERRAQADDRAVPGHWEGDLILGKNTLSAIGTLVKRTTGSTMRVHLRDGDKAEQVRDALTGKIKTIPRSSARHSPGITASMHACKEASVAADIDIDVCDPTRRGSVAPVRTPTDSCANTSPRAPT
jgi:IS30 family transposase